MPDDTSFRGLIARVRDGDEQAATELVRRYESAIRLAVRVRLTDPSLRRRFDSMDICQSVLASFFLRAASGQYELNTPEQLLRLLTTMARHKVINQARKQRAARRDHRRVVQTPLDEDAFVDPDPSPSAVVINQELLLQLRSRLSEADRHLAEQRALGRSWQEIAAEVGDQPDALRIRLSRALNRVTREMGIEE